MTLRLPLPEEQDGKRKGLERLDRHTDQICMCVVLCDSTALMCFRLCTQTGTITIN